MSKTSNTLKNMNNKTDEELSSKYQQKTDKQHILDNPDTYIGSVEKVEADLWILSKSVEAEEKSDDKIVERNMTYIPGLFKLFDEGVVNCRDHVIRMDAAVKAGQPNSIPVSYIDISIEEDGTIVMINDGNGIDIAEHPEYKVYIPELIFGQQRREEDCWRQERFRFQIGSYLVYLWTSRNHRSCAWSQICSRIQE